MRERTHGEGFATRAIHAGERPDPTTHAHATPIYATATFAFDTAAEKEDAVDRALDWDPTSYFYSRTGNPTNRALEEKIASLEGAEDCVVAASGMASVAATLFAHLDQGDHLVVGDELFVITKVLWEEDLPRRGIDVTPVDMTDLAAVEAAITERTRILFFETSTNPRLRMPDLDALADIGHRHGLHRRRRQHVPRPGPPAADRARRRPRPPRRDEVPVRPRRRGLGRRLRAEAPARPDPQADRHVRPGGQPVLVVPRPARRPDAAAALGEGVRERRSRSPASSRPTSASSGSATRASSRTPTTTSPRASWAASGSARWSRSSRAAASRAWPRSRTTSRLCDIGVSLGDVYTLVYPRPKDGGIVRVSVGCEDVEDLLEDFALGLSFVG